MPSSIGMITHDVANSLKNICGTVHLLEMGLKNHQRDHQEFNRELIISMKDECSRMKSRLEELRQSHDYHSLSTRDLHAKPFCPDYIPPRSKPSFRLG